MRNLVYYTVASWIVWFAAQALGASLGWTIFTSLVVPPFLLLALAMYRNRGMGP